MTLDTVPTPGVGGPLFPTEKTEMPNKESASD